MTQMDSDLWCFFNFFKTPQNDDLSAGIMAVSYVGIVVSVIINNYLKVYLIVRASKIRATRDDKLASERYEHSNIKNIII
jgi:hypothetical protein